jgi:hypothetical protein
MTTLKKNGSRLIAIGTLSAMTFGAMAITPAPAHAIKAKTWKKIAIGSAVVAGYGAVKGKKKLRNIGAIAAIGSYYMYKRKK